MKCEFGPKPVTGRAVYETDLGEFISETAAEAEARATGLGCRWLRQLWAIEPGIKFGMSRGGETAPFIDA